MCQDAAKAGPMHRAPLERLIVLESEMDLEFAQDFAYGAGNCNGV